MRKHKNKIIAVAVTAAVLVFTFFLGGGDNKTGPEVVNRSPEQGETRQETAGIRSGPELDTGSPKQADAARNEQESTVDSAESEAGEPREGLTGDGVTGAAGHGAGDSAQGQGAGDSAQGHGAAQTQKDQPGAQEHVEKHSGDAESPRPAEQAGVHDSAAQTEDQTERELTVTLIISVATILDNMDKLAQGKAGLIPQDGIVFSDTVVFYEGESVFNVLARETRKNRIHMEFMNTPIYNSAYIEGINNIYEFDAGERSGWIYSVNERFPNYGCSRYLLEAGDVIKWLFTCDRGSDVGGSDATDSYNWG